MPIFARVKLTIEEDCMLPSPRLVLQYSGPNPQKIYPKILDIMTTNLKFNPENIQEKEFTWNRATVPEKFSAHFEAFKDLDKFSYIFLTVEVEGSVKPSKEFGKEGEARIVIDGVVRTDYPQDTVWEKSLLYEIFRVFYHKVFYVSQIQKFKETCRDMMLTLQNEIKAFLNILPKE
jgi:hypothetical protein